MIRLLPVILAAACAACAGINLSTVEGPRMVEMGNGAHLIISPNAGSSLTCWVTWSEASCVKNMAVH